MSEATSVILWTIISRPEVVGGKRAVDYINFRIQLILILSTLKKWEVKFTSAASHLKRTAKKKKEIFAKHFTWRINHSARPSHCKTTLKLVFVNYWTLKFSLELQSELPRCFAVMWTFSLYFFPQITFIKKLITKQIISASFKLRISVKTFINWWLLLFCPRLGSESKVNSSLSLVQQEIAQFSSNYTSCPKNVTNR